VAITKDDVIELVNRFHNVVMLEKGSGAEQASFFLRPDEARIIVHHGEDLSADDNHDVHQKLTDERHTPLEPWDIIPLSSEPERARAIGAVYWEGRIVGTDDVVKCVVGEDWIVQRDVSGTLKIAVYVNPYHYFLPDSAALDLQEPPPDPRGSPSG
jgi:hypothetical protein